MIVDCCEVFLVDANHCPGAVQFLFKVPGSDRAVEKYVHTGDFRYCDSMKSVALLKDFVGADAVFLDTTYCNPKFVFPSQEESIDYVTGVVERIGAENEGKLKNVLFLVATYVIGKEKILLEISRKCNRKIHVSDRKMAVLRVLGFGESGVFSVDESQSDVHVVGWSVLGETWPYFRPNFNRMKEIMEERGYTKVIGFVPTGWTYEVKKTKFAVRVKDSFEIHLVPYSEHSNYEELREYVKFLKPKRVIPTVGMDIDKLDSKQANALRKHFAALLGVTAVKQEFLKAFHCGTRELGEKGESREEEVKDTQNGNNLMAEESVKDMDIENPSLVLPNTAKGDVAVLKPDSVEGYIRELRSCLPSWVTDDEMLDLLNKSGGDIVGAVSYFYEHETELHEQITDATSSSCNFKSSTQVGSALPLKIAENDSVILKMTGNEPELPYVLPSKHLSECEPDNLSLNQLSGRPVSLNLNKSGASPGKRKRASENKTSKKTKSSFSHQPNGPKQSTITNFFNKLAPLVPQDDEINYRRSESHNKHTLVPSDIPLRYKNEVDRFIQIVNGSESSRSHAAVLLEKTGGDINGALDIYYSNSLNSPCGEKI